MQERPHSGFRAVLVGVDSGQQGLSESLDELKLLAESAGLYPCATILAKRKRPDPALFAGKGKVSEIKAALLANSADVAVFNHELSPVQERNLANILNATVIDRTHLILDIFGRRAKSHEGKLQVELAQLEHAATRLVRGWTHLERQKGGRGFLGGMGETQLEVDRRLIARRVKTLKASLDRLKRQRTIQRRSRSRTGTMSVSLVGYTNAGKSTLFNALTHANAYAANQLFATLDTTSRRLYLADGHHVVVSDTVGFIRELPHSLVESFRATLEETALADLILHVVDCSSDARNDQVREVNSVLEEIGAADIPQILVWNKIDQCSFESAISPGLDTDEYGKISRVRLSAKMGVGIEMLRQAMIQFAATWAASQHSAARTPKQ
jgi:GTP-binding protein HflX